MNQQRRGGGGTGVWIRAQTSRPPRGEGGGYGGPLKHSMFGNQVFNVSGSRDHHDGNRVQTICFMAQNTAIMIHFGKFSYVQGCLSIKIREVYCLMIFLRKRIFHMLNWVEGCKRGVICHRAAIRYNFNRSFQNLKPPIYPLTWME